VVLSGPNNHLITNYVFVSKFIFVFFEFLNKLVDD
jgi:hypothetical protein